MRKHFLKDAWLSLMGQLGHHKNCLSKLAAEVVLLHALSSAFVMLVLRLIE